MATGSAWGCGAWTRAATARSPKGFLALARPPAVLSWEALHIQSKTCVSLSVYVWGCAPHLGAWGSLQISVAPSLRARTGRRARPNDPAHAPARRRASHVAGARSQAQNNVAHAPRPQRASHIAGARSQAQNDLAHAPARRALHVAGAK